MMVSAFRKRKTGSHANLRPHKDNLLSYVCAEAKCTFFSPQARQRWRAARLRNIRALLRAPSHRQVMSGVRQFSTSITSTTLGVDFLRRGFADRLSNSFFADAERGRVSHMPLAPTSENS